MDDAVERPAGCCLHAARFACNRPVIRKHGPAVSPRPFMTAGARSPRSIPRSQHRQARQQRRTSTTGRCDHGRGCHEVRVTRTRPASPVAQRRDQTRQRCRRRTRHDHRTEPGRTRRRRDRHRCNVAHRRRRQPRTPPQRSALPHRARPHGQRPTNPSLRRASHRRRQEQTRDHALPKALRRTRGLLRPQPHQRSP